MPLLKKFKPYCIRGHLRRGNVDHDGHCKTCRKENWGGYYDRNRYNWKYRNIRNRDGSEFTMVNYIDAMVAQQGECGGCFRHQSEFEKAFAADHDHSTGYFRGLLCSDCNIALGMVRENAKILEALIAYLRPKTT